MSFNTANNYEQLFPDRGFSGSREGYIIQNKLRRALVQATDEFTTANSHSAEITTQDGYLDIGYVHRDHTMMRISEHRLILIDDPTGRSTYTFDIFENARVTHGRYQRAAIPVIKSYEVAWDANDHIDSSKSGYFIFAGQAPGSKIHFRVDPENDPWNSAIDDFSEFTITRAQQLLEGLKIFTELAGLVEP